MTIKSGFSIFVYLISLIFIVMAAAPTTQAGCSCSVGNWDPSAFLNSELDTQIPQTAGSQDAAGSSGSKESIQQERIASFPNGDIIKPLKSVSSSDVVIDVTNGDSYASSHIKNAIHIPSSEFLNAEGNLKTDEELAAVLGDAGVSRNDSVVLYGSKESSGEAEFAFLVLRYLGQEDLTLLDGSLDDWNEAGLPNETATNARPTAEYLARPVEGVIADYNYVLSGQAQIMDVRPFTEFGKGRITGSTALDPSNVVKGDSIKDKAGLDTVFSRLDKDLPIVVYSDDFSRSSLVWYALQLIGYNASIYTWEDWKAHQATGGRNGADKTGIAQTGAGQANASGSKYMKLGTT